MSLKTIEPSFLQRLKQLINLCLQKSGEIRDTLYLDYFRVSGYFTGGRVLPYGTDEQ
jgi:hypothetical protein